MHYNYAVTYAVTELVSCYVKENVMPFHCANVRANAFSFCICICNGSVVNSPGYCTFFPPYKYLCVCVVFIHVNTPPPPQDGSPYIDSHYLSKAISTNSTSGLLAAICQPPHARLMNNILEHSVTAKYVHNMELVAVRAELVLRQLGEIMKMVSCNIEEHVERGRG